CLAVQPYLRLRAEFLRGLRCCPLPQESCVPTSKLAGEARMRAHRRTLQSQTFRTSTGRSRAARTAAAPSDGKKSGLKSTRCATAGGPPFIRAVRQILSVTSLALALSAATSFAYAEDTIKIAYTDPMSGPFAQAGQQNRM